MLPELLTTQNRVQLVHEDDNDFNLSSHKATAFEEVAALITDPLNGEQAKSNAQEVDLPIECEEEIYHWAINNFDNEDSEAAEDLGLNPYNSDPFPKIYILTVTLHGKKVRKQNAAAVARSFGSPNRNPRQRNNRGNKGNRRNVEFNDGDGDDDGDADMGH